MMVINKILAILSENGKVNLHWEERKVDTKENKYNCNAMIASKLENAINAQEDKYKKKKKVIRI